jgi:hypothetical protein
MVRGSWFMVHGSWFPVPSSKFRIPHSLLCAFMVKFLGVLGVLAVKNLSYPSWFPEFLAACIEGRSVAFGAYNFHLVVFRVAEIAEIEKRISLKILSNEKFLF